jgi:hypothetical protein
MSRPDSERQWHRYLTLREQANASWQQVAQISALVAEHFMADSPHGGDPDALSRTFTGATPKTRQAVVQCRAWLSEQGGAP